jgi:hypothetical protein
MEHILFTRSPHVDSDFHSHIANLLWTDAAPDQSIERPADILMCQLEWGYGAKAETWRLEETVVLGEHGSNVFD